LLRFFIQLSFVKWNHTAKLADMAAGSRKFGEKLEELDLSPEEIDRLAKCMKVIDVNS